MCTIGFDNEKYLAEQTEEILRRAEANGNKLYLEFGGKLIQDMHAARILPGYDPNVKLQLLQKLKEKAEIIICVYAGDIECKKMRADFGISYENDTLRLIDGLRSKGLLVRAVVITRYTGQKLAAQFKSRLEHRDINVYFHKMTQGYPADVDTIVSERGYGANEFVKTARPIVVVTAPGPGSGKLATCLSQLYHENLAGRKAGYAKFETFPVWDLPMNHPVNIAYEAATADLNDRNMIDPYHLQAYGRTTTNYNRDVDAFPLLRAIWDRMGACPYRSPTDMGVNKISSGICNDAVVREASRQEIIRRYFRYLCEQVTGEGSKACVARVEELMHQMAILPEDRSVVLPAREAGERAKSKGKGNDGIFVGAALRLPDGKVVTGCNSNELHAAAAVVLNAIKTLAGIPDSLHLISPQYLQSIIHLKKDLLKSKYHSLNLEEALIGLAIGCSTNPAAQVATEKLLELRDCEMHLTHMATPGDAVGLRRLGIRFTCDALFASKDLFMDS